MSDVSSPSEPACRPQARRLVRGHDVVVDAFGQPAQTVSGSD